MGVTYVIDEPNCAAFNRYEATSPIIGTVYGSCGGSPFFCDLDARREVQVT